MTLLLCILKLVTTPAQYKASHLRTIDVHQLEKTTNEAMSYWLGNKYNDTNGQKRYYLKQVFRLARQRERYMSGEIGKYDSSREKL